MCSHELHTSLLYNDIATLFCTGIVPLNRYHLSSNTCSISQTKIWKHYVTLGFLPKFSLRPWPQQQAVYTLWHLILTPYGSLFMSHALINQVKKNANFYLSPRKSNAWMSTTCFTNMYKNMYLGAKKGSSCSPQYNIVCRNLKWKQAKNKKWGQEKTIETKRMVKIVFFLYWILYFLCVYSKIQHLCFLIHGHSSWSTFSSHLVRAQGSQNWFKKKIGPMKKALFHGPTSWSIV